VSWAAESSLKEASLAEASEFKVPFNLSGVIEYKTIAEGPVKLGLEFGFKGSLKKRRLQ
jgi:hypothetical protein